MATPGRRRASPSTACARSSPAPARSRSRPAAARPEVEIALYDAAGRRLVDGTLAITDDQDPAATQTAWDRLAFHPLGGHHVLHVTGDSFPAEQLAVDVIDARLVAR